MANLPLTLNPSTGPSQQVTPAGYDQPTTTKQQGLSPTVDTVIQASAVDRGLIIPVKATGSPTINAGGSGYAVNDTFTNAAGVFTVTAVTSGAVTSATATTPNSLTTLPSTPIPQTSTSGSGTGVTVTPVYASQATQLAAANLNRRAINVQPQGYGIYMSGTANATADYHSLYVPPNAYNPSEPHHVGTGAISVIGASPVPVPVYAREL